MKPVTKCHNMSEVRENIDRIDAEMVALLAERSCYVRQAAELKNNVSEARINWRINEVIENVRKHATSLGIDPDITAAIWNTMIEEFIAYEEKYLSSK